MRGNRDEVLDGRGSAPLSKAGSTSAFLSIVALLSLVPMSAGAIPFRTGTTFFDLSFGRRATRTMVNLGRRGIHIQWSVEGFVEPPREQVLAYAATPSGRLVALVDHGTLYSNDGGRSWVSSTGGDGIPRAVALAMADDSFGALVTASAGVWITRDGANSWRQVREYEGTALDDVAAVGGIAVYSDTRGGVRAFDVGAGSIRSLCEPDLSTLQPATLQLARGYVDVRGSACAWTVSADGILERR